MIEVAQSMCYCVYVSPISNIYLLKYLHSRLPMCYYFHCSDWQTFCVARSLYSLTDRLSVMHCHCAHWQTFSVLLCHFAHWQTFCVALSLCHLSDFLCCTVTVLTDRPSVLHYHCADWHTFCIALSLCSLTDFSVLLCHFAHWQTFCVALSLCHLSDFLCCTVTVLTDRPSVLHYHCAHWQTFCAALSLCWLTDRLYVLYCCSLTVFLYCTAPFCNIKTDILYVKWRTSVSISTL